MRRVNPRIFKLRESPTRKIDAIREKLSKEKKDIYLLSAGQPSIPPPKELREYISQIILGEDMKFFGYTQSKGIIPLRDAIANDLKELGGLELDPEENLVVTAGGQEAMFITLSAIIEEGDEVILTDPVYFGYKPIIEYLGGKIKYTITSLENNFQPDIEDLKEKVSSRTKAIILVSPDNPTGRILDHEVGKAISDLAHDHDFWIIIDEAYKTLIYEGSHFWFWNYQPEHVIAINTFSKDPGFPGWRLGYIYAEKNIMRALKLLNEEVVYCPPVIAQIAATYYLNNKLREKFLPQVLESYKRRRDVLADSLKDYLPGVKFRKSQGSMFMFVDFSEYLKDLNMDSIKFSEELLTEKGVAVIPGALFGESCKNYIRFSFVIEAEDRIRTAIELIEDYIKSKT